MKLVIGDHTFRQLNSKGKFHRKVERCVYQEGNPSDIRFIGTQKQCEEWLEEYEKDNAN